MTDKDLFRHVSITHTGAICLGRAVVCDGFEQGFPAAVFTHAHSDHVSKLETCLHRCQIYTSKITRELLEAINNDSYRLRTQFHTVDYNVPQPIRCNGHVDYLELLESSHMLGSSQVLLTTHDGLKMLYSGDISPYDKPRKCDILVIDPTHTVHYQDKNIDSGSMERRLIDTVVENIASQKSVCIHAHRGKLQSLMHLLSEHEEIQCDVKFLTSAIDIRVANVYKKYNQKIRDLVNTEEYEGEEITYGDYPWVEFTSSMGYALSEKRDKARPIRVSGRPGDKTMSQNDAETWFASDEHAEFSDVIEYVKSAEPRAVVVDGTRTKQKSELADKIQTDLGIDSKTMPD